MGSPENHQYDGYQPFQYLDDDAFERYELPDSYQWGDSYQIELTEAEEERAAEAATDNLRFFAARSSCVRAEGYGRRLPGLRQ